MKSYRLVEVFIGHTSKKKGLHPDYRKESQHSIVRKQMTQLKHGKRLERTVQKREYMDNHNYIHEKMFTVWYDHSGNSSAVSHKVKHDPTVPLLGIYPIEVKNYIHTKTYLGLFIPVWFIITK